ncbi:MAG: ribonuclease P protein component [Oligoflexia bacterium]|nr:ribonuclease P protein component [Oligoflexia bacterium]
MANSRKNRTKKESRIPFRIYSKNFILAYGATEKDYGIFFGLSRKASRAVKRNRIKRVFKELVKDKIELYRGPNEGSYFSMCLISKKGVKFSKGYLDTELKDELKGIIDKLAGKISKST